jgi:hypothetical protein
MEQMKNRILIIIAFLILATGCDPAKMILVSNKTKKDIQVKIIQNNKNIMNIGNTDTLKLTLNSKNEGSEIAFISGIGIWSKHELELLNESVYEIQILSNNDTNIIVDKLALKKILPQKRSGLMNNILKINIE